MLNESTKPKEKQKIYILSTAFRVKVLGYSCSWGFSGISAVNNPPANAGGARDSGSIPGSGRSTGGRAWQPTPVFLPGKFPGQRSLEGYRPQGRQESDTTERLSTAQHSLKFSDVSRVIVYKSISLSREKSNRIQLREYLTENDHL